MKTYLEDDILVKGSGRKNIKLNQIGIPLSQSPLDIAEHSAMIIGFNCDLK